MRAVRKTNEHYVELKSVLDGFTISVADDGYGAGDPDAPNSGRQRLQAVLKKRGEDGKPVYYALQAPVPWRPPGGKEMFQPPDALIDRVWSKDEDKRLKENLEKRGIRGEEAKARIAAGVVTKGPLAAELEVAEGAKAAKAAAGATAKAGATPKKGGGDAS